MKPSGLVVDASVSAAWFLEDEASDYSEAALQATADREVWVSAIWLLETANLLLSAQRRRRINAAKRHELGLAASQLQLHVDREAIPIPRIEALAADHQLSAYDAAYLELALRRRLPLATMDAALLKVLPAAGIALAAF